MKKTLFFSILVTILFFSSCGNERSTEESSNTETSSENTSSDDDNTNEVSVEEMSRKKELLTSLIGNYTLDYIEGAMGANGMVEYTLHDAEWRALASSIEEGVREAYDFDLTSADQKKINSMLISVSDDLTVTFSSNGKDYFSVLFSEEGMSYNLAKPVADYYSVIPEALTPTTKFVNSDLYLYAEDGFKEGELEGADILDIGADAMMLTYNESSKSFELSIFYADCCDTGIYTFK